MQLGQMIVKLRKEQGLTQETFAKKFNVTRQTVSNWENEKSYPDLHTLVKISDEFHLSLDILLKGNPTMVNDIDKKVKKHTLYKGIILGLILIIAVLASVIYLTNKTISDVTKDSIGKDTEVAVIEVYNSSNNELLKKYDDKNSIKKFISALNMTSWKNANISENTQPQYLIKLYDSVEGQNNNITELTIYEGGEYATIFMTSPGGAKKVIKQRLLFQNWLIRKQQGETLILQRFSFFYHFPDFNGKTHQPILCKMAEKSAFLIIIHTDSFSNIIYSISFSRSTQYFLYFFLT